jgi:hypothetical protein
MKGASPVPREPRIDILRGFAILTIVLNHLTQAVDAGGLRGGFIPTPTRYGYSTAAELFVFLSGYMVGLVYLARPAPIRAILRRAGTLWLYDLALLALVLPLAAIMTPAELAFWQFTPFLTTPVQAAIDFATLQHAPRLLDILQLYIILMLVAPVAIALHRRSPALMVALSLLLYVAAQVLIIRRIALDPDGRDDGLLKLLSWQALFFVPMALGAWRVHSRVFAWLERNWAALAILIGLFVVAAFAKIWQAEPTLFSPRHGLHLLRLGHALLVLLLYASLLTLAGPLLRLWPFRAIGTIGRHSLDCFAAGVVITYLLALVWDRVGGGHALYYLLAMVAVLLTGLVATWRDRRPGRSA